VGDDVNYTITLSNNSSADTPAMNCTADDTLLGQVFNGVLPLGDTVLNLSRTVQAGDPDPLPNTVTLTCSPAGFPNVLTAEASHSVNLFQPSISFDKTGDTLSKVGDNVNYVLTLNNTSSADSPDLECTVTDPMLGIDKSVTVAAGASDVTNATYTVQAGDPDPLVNTASVSCSPIGFPNVLTASDDHSVNLFQPSVEITKDADCPIDGVAIGENITYTYTIHNTSSTDSPALNLASIVDDKLGNLAAEAAANGCSTLAPDATCSFTKTESTSGLPVGPRTNTVNALYHPEGFPNDITAQASRSCDIVLPAPARVVIEKVLLGSEGMLFTYSDNNLTVPSGAGSFPLTPLFAGVQHPSSPFAVAGAGNGFASTAEIVVNVPDITQTVQSSVSENMPLPTNVYFKGLLCQAATGGNLSGSSVVDATATLTLGSGDFAFCRYTNEYVPPKEGCTPGYWRNHLDRWAETPYSPTDDFDATFGTNLFNPDVTLFYAIDNPQVVGQLPFQGVAALLSAAHPDVDYPYSVAQVIAYVQAGNVQPLADANKLSCPIN